MSLVESPLYLILLPNVKIRLDRSDGRRVLFPAERSFVLNIHGERSGKVETVEGGRVSELGELCGSAKSLYTPPSKPAWRDLIN